MAVWLGLFLALGAAGTWLARVYAMQRNLIDHPGDRRSHGVPTPRGGGIAIVIGLLVATIALAARHPAGAVVLLGFAMAVLLVAGIGWWDDHRPLSAGLRLGVHLVAASILSLVMLGNYGNPWLAIAALVAAVVLTNVWNFMDGIDGLAASQAALVSAAFAAALSGSSWSWLGWALAASCIGFLPFNCPRARIFLGDVGSGTLGLAIAALATMAVGEHRLAWPLAVLPLAPFLTDAGLTLARRVWRREPWWTAHTQHAYQAWARRLGSHVPVTGAYALWTGLGVVLAAGLRGRPWTFMLAGVLAWYMSCAFFWWCLQRSGAGNRRPDQVEWHKE
jgi:UDP-N-acetylmuramyl pentapeptide phosphotransferase/UDP-N-acetylglucosamine-1-phosphate transferase